jgi:hypothetical protein
VLNFYSSSFFILKYKYTFFTDVPLWSALEQIHRKVVPQSPFELILGWVWERNILKWRTINLSLQNYPKFRFFFLSFPSSKCPNTFHDDSVWLLFKKSPPSLNEVNHLVIALWLLDLTAKKSQSKGMYWFLIFFFAKQALYRLSHTSSPFFSVYFEDGMSWTICSYWPQTAILLFSVSQAVEIMDVSHWHLGHLLIGIMYISKKLVWLKYHYVIKLDNRIIW